MVAKGGLSAAAFWKVRPIFRCELAVSFRVPGTWFLMSMESMGGMVEKNHADETTKELWGTQHPWKFSAKNAPSNPWLPNHQTFWGENNGRTADLKKCQVTNHHVVSRNMFFFHYTPRKIICNSKMKVWNMNLLSNEWFSGCMLDMLVFGGVSVDHHPKEDQHVSMMVNFYVGWKNNIHSPQTMLGKGDDPADPLRRPTPRSLTARPWKMGGYLFESFVLGAATYLPYQKTVWPLARIVKSIGSRISGEKTRQLQVISSLLSKNKWERDVFQSLLVKQCFLLWRSHTFVKTL